MKRVTGSLAIILIAASALLLACAGATSESAPAQPAPQIREQSASFGLDRPLPARAMAEMESMAQEVMQEDASGYNMETAAMATPPPAPMSEMAAMEPAAKRSAGGDGSGNGSGRQSPQTVQRKVISIATVSLEVESVETAVGQVRDIAGRLGGFVEQLSSSGGSESPFAELTVRVPQPQFEPALTRIEALGEVQSRELGSEDVTEQFIDLSARLRTSRREEQSLLALLERSSSVTEILTVERELTRVRSDIERAQGQLTFLERQVDLATIRVVLFPPGTLPTNPPVASYTMDVSNVSDRVARLKNFVAGLGGELDEVHLLTFSDGEQADITFRVFAQDFDRTAEFIEGQGRTRYRELREGINLPGEETPRAKRPEAQIVVSYVDQDFNFQPWLLVSIVVVVAALAGGTAFLMRLAYRRGRMRGSFI